MAQIHPACLACNKSECCEGSENEPECLWEKIRLYQQTHNKITLHITFEVTDQSILTDPIHRQRVYDYLQWIVRSATVEGTVKSCGIVNMGNT